MRDTIHRGKRLDNGELVEGLLSKALDVNNILQTAILYEENGEIKTAAIDPETACAYTEMKDRKKERVFEGDILRCVWYDEEYAEKYGDVVISIGEGDCIDDDNNVVYRGYGVCLTTEKTGERCLVDINAIAKCFEIIGNIHYGII